MDGFLVGLLLGCEVGWRVGCREGWPVGWPVGEVGENDGALVVPTNVDLKHSVSIKKISTTIINYKIIILIKDKLTYS